MLCNWSQIKRDLPTFGALWSPYQATEDFERWTQWCSEGGVLSSELHLGHLPLVNSWDLQQYLTHKWCDTTCREICQSSYKSSFLLFNREVCLYHEEMHITRASDTLLSKQKRKSSNNHRGTVNARTSKIKRQAQKHNLESRSNIPKMAKNLTQKHNPESRSNIPKMAKNLIFKCAIWRKTPSLERNLIK